MHPDTITGIRVVLFTALLIPSAAFADLPSVRVTRFERDARRQDERAVTRALRDDGFDVGPNGDVIVRGEVSDDELTLRIRVRGRTRTVRVRGDSPQERGQRGAAEIREVVGGREDAQEEPAETQEEPEESSTSETITESPRERERERENERENERERDDEDEDEDEPASERSALSAFSISLSGGMMRRRLAFRDDLFGTVSNYTLGAAPMIGLTAVWFPGAHVETGHPLAGFGIIGDYRAMFGVSSESDTGETFDTRSMSASVDLAYRVPVATHAFGGRVGFGSDTFFVEAAQPASPDGRNAPRVPRAFYRYVRIGADVDLHLAGPLRLITHGGIRVLLQTGDLDHWFPNHRELGFETGVALELAFDVATLRLYADYVRYAFAFRPEPGAADVVGGASDNWLILGLSIGVRARGPQ